ncbi:site-specific tyrosine recombinase XerD [Boudabousia marimammalium]|uniref:Tyrosine recombinase XerC n=1 Tax=Boudabousia marimammalium TaxID=156892 RepID=A0A1Q5PRA5_9ACTO|nr:site-specific tyrosine recombinase XerD [Boudabousia marimammalium]OKL50019.1 site-specific tyrosine recombinase XerD [Boudabousia marimammalium]
MKIESTIRQFISHMAVERGASKHTVEAYQRDCTRYAAWLQSQNITDLNEVTAVKVGEFVASLGRGEQALAPTSISRVLASIRGLYSFAVQEGYATNNPAAEVPTRAQQPRLPKALTIEQVELLLAAASEGDPKVALRDRAFLELAYSTGARVSELVQLHVDDIDTSSDLTFVTVTGKGNKQRLVPIGGPATAALQQYLVRCRPSLVQKGEGTSRLFVNKRGKALSRQSAWEILQVAADRAELPVSVSPHTLRHSFATHLLEGGADVRVVQELLGHASVNTTQIYTKLTANTLRDVYVESHPRAL